MPKTITGYYISTISPKGKQSGSFSSTPTRKEIEQATREYLAKGGIITKVEPEWIEVGELYISR